MENPQLREILLQALETELGGTQVYRAALRCVRNEDLKKEWTEYLEQTENHVRIVRELCDAVGVDPEGVTPGRLVVRAKGKALVDAMELALDAGDPAGAELVAAECVVDAEMKDHQNWELIGELGKSEDDAASALAAAHEEVEDEEDEHVYHSMGWARELWIAALGLPAVLPPPEEQKDVKTAIGAARAKQARTRMQPAKKGKSKRSA
jgi:rubrerythrin